MEAKREGKHYLVDSLPGNLQKESVKKEEAFISYSIAVGC